MISLLGSVMLSCGAGNRWSGPDGRCSRRRARHQGGVLQAGDSKLVQRKRGPPHLDHEAVVGRRRRMGWDKGSLLDARGRTGSWETVRTGAGSPASNAKNGSPAQPLSRVVGFRPQLPLDPCGAAAGLVDTGHAQGGFQAIDVGAGGAAS
ncbi:hypothetical protein GCM10010211_81240 [Streptomyces albospinus]|uniref:Uncharacterized protein n=1 Tax=Streptomyces albospinus TaxID=285515 RepID=A0ABQ2VNN5_9ACTN|nr:hypothetical protein GCM10010211_81240 [Streptomyces albospinus]